MKKVWAIILAVGVITLFYACETTNVYPNTSKSFVYTIDEDAWVDEGFRIYTDINLPELTEYYLKQGGVNVSISFNDESSYDVLPSTFDGVAYSVNYSRGRVTIIGEDPLIDENILIPLPENTAHIKIVLTETDYSD